MTTDYPEGNELDCYEASEARECGGTIHLGMDATQNEDQRTYWNVFVPAKWDMGQRLLLLTEEEFRAVGNVLLLEALAVPQYSVLSRTEAIAVNNLVAPQGKFHLAIPLRQCPETDCQTVLDRLGDKHWHCSECGAIIDEDGELATWADTGLADWEELDPMTQEFDDALSIVRSETMEVIDDPHNVLTKDGVTKMEQEAHEAYEDHGGPNHSNHDDFQE